MNGKINVVFELWSLKVIFWSFFLTIFSHTSIERAQEPCFSWNTRNATLAIKMTRFGSIS